MKMKKEQTTQNNLAEVGMYKGKSIGIFAGTKGELDDSKGLKEMFYNEKFIPSEINEDFIGYSNLNLSDLSVTPFVKENLTITCTLNKEKIKDKKFQVVYDNNIYYTETNKFTFMEFPINGEDLISLINRSLAKVDLANIIDIKLKLS